VFEVRTEIAKVCLEMADKCGEPPVDLAGRTTGMHDVVLMPEASTMRV